jgi:hemolysin activation/secretion protein
LIALYAVWADSDTAFGEGFEVIGKGQIFGFRYIKPLPSLDSFSHNLTMGVDYKDFDEDVNFLDSENEGLKTPIKYMPLLFSYSATRSDKKADTRFSLGLNLSIRNLVTDQREFEIKRYKARGNYLFVTAGIERTQKLPYGMSLFAKLDGQIASQPLISNEQYVAGGMDSVRGYQESELSGDHALHGSMELMFPELQGILGIPEKIEGTPYMFYDMAELWTRSPLPGEEKYRGIRGTGVGIRGKMMDKYEYEIDASKALKATGDVRRGHYHFYFRLKYIF